MPVGNERLARMEERQIAHGNLLSSFIAEQREINRILWETRDKVNEIKAKSAGAIWVLSLFGGLTVAVSTGAAWIFEQRHTIMHWIKGG